MRQILASFLVMAWASAAWAGLAESCERMLEPKGPVRGVLLVTHGMNLKPSRMDEWLDTASGQGYLAIRGAFAGHCGSNDEYLEVRASQWEADARRMHAFANSQAKKHRVPLFLLSYSFSAAVFQSMRTELAFDGRVLLAPALSDGKFWYPLVAKLARWFPWVMFPSLNIPGYGVHPWSGFAAIAAVSELEERERALRKQGPDSVPTLVLISPKDELIEAKDMEALAKENKNWRLEEVRTVGHTLPRSFHHLIVTEESLGDKEWKRVNRLVWNFLGFLSPPEKKVTP